MHSSRIKNMRRRRREKEEEIPCEVHVTRTQQLLLAFCTTVHMSYLSVHISSIDYFTSIGPSSVM
jgi:hypothetical protein